MSRLVPSMVITVLGATGAGLAAQPDRIPALAEVPNQLPEPERKAFGQRRGDLEAAFQAFKERSGPFNRKAAKDQSDADFAAIMAQRNRYIAAATRYNEDLALRVAAAERRRVIQAMNGFVGHLDWDAKKKARVAAALEALGADGDPSATSAQARETWRQVLARGGSRDLPLAAAGGQGANLSGAGTQSHQDCAVFALANATGRPYGVVAAQATDLIAKAPWREAKERAAPEQTLARRGLNGGEVILLAEAFGRVDVKPRSDFPAILKAGHPVLINVVSADGDWDSGHEVVLSRTFQHEGETWYQMLDSNRPVAEPLYLSHRELSIILQEMGVIFRPEPGSIPQSLKSETVRAKP